MLSKSNPPQVESPCVRNCCLNEQDVCVGCFRSLDEILAWSKVDEAQQLRILENTHKRRQQLKSLKLTS